MINIRNSIVKVMVNFLNYSQSVKVNHGHFPVTYGLELPTRKVEQLFEAFVIDDFERLSASPSELLRNQLRVIINWVNETLRDFDMRQPCKSVSDHKEVIRDLEIQVVVHIQREKIVIVAELSNVQRKIDNFLDDLPFDHV